MLCIRTYDCCETKHIDKEIANSTATTHRTIVRWWRGICRCNRILICIPLYTPALLRATKFHEVQLNLHAGADLRWGRGNVPPEFTCCPQIQMLADHSDVISAVPICSEIQIFLGSAPDPARELTVLPRPPSWWGGGSLLPSQEPHPGSRPFGPRFYRSQGLTHYRVGDPTNDRFQM